VAERVAPVNKYHNAADMQKQNLMMDSCFMVNLIEIDVSNNL